MTIWTTIWRADQSPLNIRRWQLILACGHELWKTTARRPKAGARIRCQACADDAAGVPTAEEVRVEAPNEETWERKRKRTR